MLLTGSKFGQVYLAGLTQWTTAHQLLCLIGGFLWLAIFFAGTVAMERSFADERDEGCWDGLSLSPVSPTAIYLAKLASNVVAMTALEAILIPLFVVLSGVELASHPWAMLLVALAGNVGIAAVGTLLSALAAGIRRNASLLVLLVLPLAAPVVIAAAEATRLTAEGSLGAEFWCWVQLLGGFALVFTTAGTLLFAFVVED